MKTRGSGGEEHSDVVNGVNRIQWIGTFISDFSSLMSSSSSTSSCGLPLTDYDLGKIQSLSTRWCTTIRPTPNDAQQIVYNCHCDIIGRELAAMKQMGIKAEIEALTSTTFAASTLLLSNDSQDADDVMVGSSGKSDKESYLTKYYLPTKIKESQR
jgi:hypothetical protein